MKRLSKNPFIVIEALDAGGSQTQTDLLVGRLKKEKYKVLDLHFPQEDRATGRMVYDKFLLPKNKGRFSKREQALLYIQDFFSRVEDMEGHLQAKSKRAVVSDRYCTSTFAYQTLNLSGLARKKMMAWVNWLCYEGTPKLFKPDLVIFIDTPVEVSLRRLADKKKDFFETKAKLTGIRNSYLRVAQEQKWLVIQGVDVKGEERTRQDLQEQIWQLVQDKIE